MDARWTERLDRLIERLMPDMVAVRRHLHAHPEPSGFEVQTCAYLRDRLSKSGLNVRSCVAGRGLMVEPANPPPCPLIALRADTDALRLQDAKRVDYRSRVAGVMHACGHDAHTAIVLGAGLGLQQAEEAGALPWPVRWRALFQPAEETNLGAREMIADGALEGVSAILALHVDPSRDVGTIGYRVGPLTATCDELQILIEGRGGHAARPHESIDPIATAAQLISCIYLFVPRAVESHDSVVVSFGQIAGGDAPNVIPQHVRLRGTLRTHDEDLSRHTKQHIHRLAQGTAAATGTRVEVDFATGPVSVNNDPALTAHVCKAARDVLGPDHVHEIDWPSMGGDDFANYLESIPGCMFRLGCRSGEIGGAPLHAPEFDIDERALTIGANILARAVVAWSDPESRTTGQR